MSFPPEHWVKIHSTDGLERLNAPARPERYRRSNDQEGTLTMAEAQDRIIDELMKRLIQQGPGGMAAVFTCKSMDFT